MTVPKKLVVDGDFVKLRCAERDVEVGGVCKLDWCRYTVDRSAVVLPVPFAEIPSLWSADRYHPFWLYDVARLVESMRAEGGEEGLAMEQAFFVANEVADCLGPDFTLGELTKGHDFYKHRIPLLLAGQECAAVHFWSVSDKPHHSGQRDTINVNIHGHACTFAEKGWERRIYAMGKRYGAVLTTVHLAVDYYDGIPGGLETILSEYRAGFWDHLGKRPKIDDDGWVSEGARSLYIGVKVTGKQLNWYEKADQLYGVEEAAARGLKWLRAEYRYGNKLRVLDWDMLLRPGDFFAGSCDAAAHYYALAVEQAKLRAVANPQSLPCDRPDALMAVEAECARVVRWVRQTAGASLATIFKYLSDADLAALLYEGGVPRRLRKFSPSQVKTAFDALCYPDLRPFGAPA